jgi:hypothetical protein
MPLAWISANIARSKGKKWSSWFLYGCFFGIITFFHALSLKERAPIDRTNYVHCSACKGYVVLNESEINEEKFDCPICSKKSSNEKYQPVCPFCKEKIKSGAIKCKHCGSDLSSQNPDD